MVTGETPKTLEESMRPKVSMEEAAKTKVAKRAMTGVTTTPSPAQKQQMIMYLIDHMLLADDMQLLQLTPIPRNAIFDIAYDVTQRAVLDKYRIDNQIPLSAVFLEVYLRAIRGANNMLGIGMMDAARDQMQAGASGEVEEWKR